MNRPFEPGFDQRIADWLEDDPSRAPRQVLDTVLAAYPSIPQRRASRAPWRYIRMDRLAGLGVAAVAAIVAIVLGAAILAKPSEPAAMVCPKTVSEADAIDTSVPGLPSSARAWGTRRAGAGQVGSGWIAGFATEAPDTLPGTVVLLDPGTGQRCDLIQLSGTHRINETTSLQWSPSGDALAIGLAGEELNDGPRNGVVLLWTADRLFKLWGGNPGDSPRLEWAPDGSGLVIWSSDGSMNNDGTPDAFDTRLLFADGSADRAFDFFPFQDGLRWSPDGRRWAVATATEAATVPTTAVAIVDVADGRATPIDVGMASVTPIGWTDDGTVLFRAHSRGQSPRVFLEVPVADPPSRRVLAGFEDLLTGPAILSPDRAHILYVYGVDWSSTGGDLRTLDVNGPAEAAVRLAPGKSVVYAGGAWSPDGGRVLFYLAGDNGLWSVNADGSGARRVTTGGFFVADHPWQPVPAR